jgi:hypothetical protein
VTHGQSDDDVAAAYWQRHRLANNADRNERLAAPQLDWAVDAVDAAIDSGSTTAIRMLLAICAAATSDDDVAALGAGPLEEFLQRPLGDGEMSELESAIRRTPRLRAALGHVWWSEIPGTSVDRFRPLCP